MFRQSIKLRIIITFALLVLIAPLHLSAKAKSDNCKRDVPSIVITTKNEKMYLCDGKNLHKSFSIAIGKDGWGKKKQGDNKSPTGRYVIGKPRASKKFHIFIPIGYPTLEQKRKGYTGNAIGIHGPWQPLKWLGRLNTLINWTQGCIAVGRNSDINMISSWIKEKSPKYIYVE